MHIYLVCGASPRTDIGTDPAGLFTTPAERCSEKLVDLGKKISLLNTKKTITIRSRTNIRK